MRFYSYRFVDVMDEDARIFFTMLNEAYKIGANEKLEEINIILMPHMKKHDRNEIRQAYKKMTLEPTDLEVDDNFDNINKLKGIL